MKTMSPGERKARTGSATGRLSVDNMPKPGMSNFRKRRKMLAEGSLIPKGKKRK
jgi:hypothetical protein